MLILDLDWFDEVKFVLLTQLQQSDTIPGLLLTSYEEYGDRANQQFGNVLDIFIKPFKMQDIIQFGKRLQVTSEQIL